ncbi:MAG: hypothetical protein ACK5PB_03250 [Pirellula sp.]|jgi:hypothetical protein
MENSRRSKKRSKFFWPEIGLLILGLLGFKPELLYNVFGASTQSNYGTTRPVNPQPPTSQHPLTSNPLLAWGAQAIQSAASQTMNGLPISYFPQGQSLQTQPAYPHYAAVQNLPYQQPMNYTDYAYPTYQSTPQTPGYPSPNSNWVTGNPGNYYAPTAATNFAAPSNSNRVPPVEYQNTPANFQNQTRPAVPFPSTNAVNQPSDPAYGNYYSANYNGQPPYNVAGYTTSPTNSYLPNQTAFNQQSPYFWGAVDPRVNNPQRTSPQSAGTQGSWAPNAPTSNIGVGRVGRY